MDNVIQFRKFTREQLMQSHQMELLKQHGTEKGLRLYNFILDAYDDKIILQEEETIELFIKICVEVFNDMESDNEKS